MPFRDTTAATTSVSLIHSLPARACLCVLVSVTILAAPTGCSQFYKPEGELVFADEFEGSNLDRTVWNTEMVWGRKTTGELQRYEDSCIEVRDGQLHIFAKEQQSEDRRYASGVIASFDRFEFTYGYAEIRARMPEGQGLWPAFWLASADTASGSEIDVVEFLGHEPNTMHMALHYDANGEHFEPLVTYIGEDFTDGWHTFAVDWSPEAVVWYVDGVERARRMAGVPAGSMYLIANLAVGGEWPGEPDGTTQFPATYEIDYIRVYER